MNIFRDLGTCVLLGTVGLVPACAEAPPSPVTAGMNAEELVLATEELDDCGDEAVAARVEEEKRIIKEFIDNNCMPSNFSADPCKGLYRKWTTLKGANAACNSKKKNQSLCDYYRDLVNKYEDIADQCKGNKISDENVPENMKPMTAAQYCKYGEVSLNHFKKMRDEKCASTPHDRTM